MNHEELRTYRARLIPSRMIDHRLSRRETSAGRVHWVRADERQWSGYASSEIPLHYHALLKYRFPKDGQKGGTMPTHNSGALARKSERALLTIPIRVEGEDAHGNAFAEVTSTLVVNRSGGLIPVSHPLKLGSAIRITNLKNQASSSFEVVSRASRSLSGNPEWGVKCLEPEVEIWGVYFPTRVEEPRQADIVHVLLECQECLEREMATLTVPQYRRLMAQSSLPRPCPKCNTTKDWKLGFVEVELREVPPALLTAVGAGATSREGAELRRDKRLVVKLPLELRLPNGFGETSTTENISKSGVCFASGLEMQVGDRVYLSVGGSNPGEGLDIPSRVVWRRPAKEKGRAFYGVALEEAA